jgi:hypothetical protein
MQACVTVCWHCVLQTFLWLCQGTSLQISLSCSTIHPSTELLCILPPSSCIHRSLGIKIIYFVLKGICGIVLSPLANTNGNINVSLSIKIKSNTVPCYIVFTGCMDNSLQYSFLKILYTNKSVLTNPTEVRNHLQWLRVGVILFCWVRGVNGNIPNSGS